MILNIMEWNINQRANKGNKIPLFVCTEIINRNPDIVVLTEFVKNEEWENLKQRLEDGAYKLFYSTSCNQGVNKVLIACKEKKGLNINSDEVIEIIDETLENPNFLKIIVKYNENSLTIIGIRIRDGNNQFKKEQFRVLKKYLEKINGKVVCVGDFNAWGSFIANADKWNLLPKGYEIYQ